MNRAVQWFVLALITVVGASEFFGTVYGHVAVFADALAAAVQK